MRKPEQAPEPSIEEILASIRRIIADDAPHAAVVAEDIGEVRLQAYAGERRIRAVEAPTRGPEPKGSEDEVLELTEDFMLAEEAPTVELREPGEPQEVNPSGTYDDRYSAQSYDPYDDQAEARSAEPEPAAAPAVAPVADEEPVSSPSKGLASVMAEVQRFTGFGKSAEPKPAPVSAPAASEPAEETNSPMGGDGPVGTWGQPNLEALTADSAPRLPASRWSARSKANDAAKGNEALAAARSARTAQQPARENPPPKPAFGSRESWNEGVQMPVPQEGPAMPFGAEESGDIPPLPSLGPSADTPQKPAISADAAQGDARGSLPGALHLRAEQLAAQAVADFASDRLSALSGQPVVTDILKGDQPLMDEITSTLADALSKTSDESEEFEDAAPPLEDFADEGFAPDLSAQDEAQKSAGPENLMPRHFGLDGGFVASQHVATSSQPASRMADQETPELPREEMDYFGPAPGSDFPDSPLAYGSTGSSRESPNMPQMSTPAPRMAARPGPSVGGTMSLERLQPAGHVKTLEDTVREMLKPLLVQWLNENMPRIINDALREEIASSGLVPRLDNERR